MATTDPLLTALGFEGFIVENTISLKPKIPRGFEGFGLVESSPFTRFPTGFEGFIVEYRPNEKFIQVLTSRGRPLVGANVFVDQSVDINAVTDSEGLIFGIFDTAGTLPVRIKSGNTYYDFTIDATNQPIVTTFVFPLDYNDCNI